MEGGTDWFTYGIALIDYKKYREGNEKEKEQIVFDCITAGLNDIATLDKLDQSVIDKTIAEIKIKGLNTELAFKTVENKNHRLDISYQVRSMEERCPVFFTITDKLAGKSNKTEIGRADKDQIRMWLHKVILTKKQIKIVSSESIAAGVYLKNMPKNMVFEIEEIFKSKVLNS